MSKKMIKTLASGLSITSTGAQAGIRMNETPFLAGGGLGGTNGGARNAILQLNAAIGGAGVVLIQGHDANNGAAASAPASGDSGWFTIATLNSASPLQQEIELAPWMRVNVGTAGTGTVTATLEGVQ